MDASAVATIIASIIGVIGTFAGVWYAHHLQLQEKPKADSLGWTQAKLDIRRKRIYTIIGGFIVSILLCPVLILNQSVLELIQEHRILSTAFCGFAFTVVTASYYEKDESGNM
jgi:hypothetical protein